MGAIPAHAAEDVKPVKEEIIYSIVLDRFSNGDQSLDEQLDLEDPATYHGGDFQGVIDKLDAIKSRGFTTISLSPVMANGPRGFHGYWIEDFFKVEEQFGNLDDLKRLVKEAHDRDIKVVFEFVTNYVGTSHPMLDDPAKTNWVEQTTGTDSLWLEEAVELNQENPEVKDMLFEAATYWLKEVNIDGYKLHAIEQSSPSFLKDFVDHIKSVKSDAYVLGGVLEDNKLSDEYLDIGIPVIEYTPVQESIVNVFTNVGTPVKNIYETWQATGEREGLLYVDNAYTDRFTRKIVEGNLNPQTTWKLALAYLYTAPGVPLVFQGSEIPMDGNTTEEVLRMVQFNSGDAIVKDFMEKISAIRTQFPVFSYGDFKLVDTNGALSVFSRTYKDETVYMAFNNGKETKSVSVKDVPEGMQLSGLLGDYIVRENTQEEYKITMDRETVEVFILEENKGLNWLFISMVVGIFAVFVISIMILSYKQRKRERKN